MTDAAKAETDAWLSALELLVAVPTAHAEPALGLAEGRDFLACSEETWDALLAADLPRHGDGLDRHDLVNLALLAGCGRSIPELALRFAMRFVTAGGESWCVPARWHFALELPAVEPSTPAKDRGEAEWRVWPPLPWPEPESPPAPLTLQGSRAEEGWEVEVTGRKMNIASPRARAAIASFEAEGRRFVRMPVEVQWDTAWMDEHRLFDCLSGSLDLARRCAREGLETRVRQGWLASQAASAHAWLEIRDDDGEWKPVDIAFRALAGSLFPQCEEFREFCLGSRLNRLLATAVGPGEPPIERLGPGAAEALVSIYRAKAATPAVPR